MKLLNLDKLVPDDKMIQVQDQKYIVPAEVPAKYILKIMKTQAIIDENPTDPEAISVMMDTVFSIFKIRNQKLNREKFDELFSIQQMAQIMEFIFNDDINGEEKKTAEAVED